MATLKNIVLFGASGSVGAAVLDGLLKAGKFNITVLQRQTSKSTFPAKVTVKGVDLESVDSVTAALEGQDAVISTVGTAGALSQKTLVEAAVKAGIKRFLPSDFGCDLNEPKTRDLPVFKNKIAVHNALRDAAAKNPEFTYTLVCNCAFLDWGLENNVLLNWKEGKPRLYDGGSRLFSATALDSVAQAVVGVLTHPDETKNRFVYVKDIDVSQKLLLEIAKKIDPAKKWEEAEDVSTAAIEESSNKKLAAKQVDSSVMIGYILRAIFGPSEYGSHFTKTDNELLGIKGKTEADIEAILKGLLLKET